MNNHKLVNNLNKILQWLLIAVTVSPLIFHKYFYYPFITGKILYFRILIFIGILILATIFFIRKKIQFKPNKIWWAFLAYLFFMLISSFFGVSFIRSFWSNIERAEGTVFWIFLFSYFSLLIYALREVKMWRWFFRVSLATSVLVIGYGLLQNFGLLSAISTTGSRVSSTLGNPAYMGSYALMHFFIALYLIYKDKFIAWRIFYALALVFNVWAIFLTQTRGAVVAWIAGLLILGLLTIFRSKKANFRRIGVIGLIIVVLLSLTALFLKDTSLIQSNDTLKRVTNISINSYTVQTRLVAWRTSFEAFGDKPIFGWGPENYGYAFSKYFPPEIYVDSGSRIWFDKAHNVFFENLVTTGIPGVILYFTIIFLAILYLFKSKRFSVVTSNIFISLLLAHLVANMFVFDSVSTYILWVAVLAFIINVGGEKNSHQEYTFNLAGKIGLATVLIFFFYLSYLMNVSAMVDNRNLLYAEAHQRSGNHQDAYDYYLKAIDNNNSYTRFEIGRELAVFARNVADSLPNHQVSPMLTKATQEIQKSIAMDPHEIRHYYNLSQLYLKSYKLDVSHLQKVIDLGPTMIELAPRRAHTYYQIGEAHVLRKEYDQALENFQQAVELNPDIIDPYINVYAATLLKEDQVLADQTRATMIAINPNFFNSEQGLLRYIPLYKTAGRQDLIIDSFERLIQLAPEKVEYVSSYAVYYAQLGDNQQAEKIIKRLQGQDPALDEQVAIFIGKIYNGEFLKK